MPLLFAGTPADFTHAPFHSLKFGLSSPDGEQVRAQVNWAHDKLGKRRFGILYHDDETGQNVLRATGEQLEVHGLQIAERASYERGTIDFSSQIARLEAANVDVVVLGTIVRETASAKLEARFGKNPEDGIVFGYTSVMLFAEGAENADRNLTVDSLVQGLGKIRNLTTTFAGSPVRFSETERLGARATMLMQARGGKFVPITAPITC